MAILLFFFFFFTACTQNFFTIKTLFETICKRVKEKRDDGYEKVMYIWVRKEGKWNYLNLFFFKKKGKSEQ